MHHSLNKTLFYVNLLVEFLANALLLLSCFSFFGCFFVSCPSIQKYCLHFDKQILSVMSPGTKCAVKLLLVKLVSKKPLFMFNLKQVTKMLELEEKKNAILSLKFTIHHRLLKHPTISRTFYTRRISQLIACVQMTIASLLFSDLTTSHLVVAPFAHSAPFLWNNLPCEIRQSPTLPVFKSKLKIFFFK